MIDPKLIVTNFDEIQERFRLRDPSLNLDSIKELYLEKKGCVQELEQLRAERNRISKEYASSKNLGLLEKGETTKAQIKDLEKKLTRIESDLYEKIIVLPNLPHVSVPLNDKVVLREERKINLDFEPEDHVSISKKLGLIDFEKGTKLASQKFVVYTNLGSQLEYALQNYFLDCVRSRGFSLISPPLLANERVLFVAGQLPKFKDQVYLTQDSLYLIPTVEVSLVALHIDDVLKYEDLPIKYTSLTPNFRREAGAAGKRDKGLIRMHQYSAVEMVIFNTPERSYESLDEMVEIAEAIVCELGIPYRITLLPIWDLAQQSAKTVDIEVFLPSQNDYYEVSSCSNCEEYQSRRGNIRFRDGTKKSRFVHTLNGTALATSRVLPAILENYQQKDGSVIVPKSLRRYLDNREIIEPVK